MTVEHSGRWIAAAGVVLLMTACSSGGITPPVGTTTPHASVSASASAANPVDLLHKIPNITTTETQGQPAPYPDPRHASGHVGIDYLKPSFAAKPGEQVWGTQVDVWTFASPEVAASAAAAARVQDHFAVIAGPNWMAEVDAGYYADPGSGQGTYKFDPSPAAVAAALGGRVVHVYP